jgi:hypothetical protein
MSVSALEFCEHNRMIVIPDNLKQIYVPAPIRSSIRKSSLLTVMNEDESISEVNVDEYWFPVNAVTRKEKGKTVTVPKYKLYAPKFEKSTNSVFWEYVSETHDLELAQKMVEDAWETLHKEQNKREKRLNEWLKANNLTLVSRSYAVPQ